MCNMYARYIRRILKQKCREYNEKCCTKKIGLI